jgi:hypothetical protein
MRRFLNRVPVPDTFLPHAWAVLLERFGPHAEGPVRANLTPAGPLTTAAYLSAHGVL